MNPIRIHRLQRVTGVQDDRRESRSERRLVAARRRLRPWRRRDYRWVALAAAVLVAAAAWVAVAELSAPGVSARSGPGQFSVERAMSDVRFLARVPRPMGSAGAARARAYIIGQLRSMGLSPRVQTTSVVGGFDSENHTAARVTNIVARLPGTATTGAVAFNAHYDSVAQSPGASDCGSCVAAVLETARTLRAGPRLRNDVLFVFTDGEESQDIGARAFATQNPAMRGVSTVVNFDTSGSHGAVYVARTSPDSGDLVRQLVASAPHPRIFSLIPALMTVFVSNLRPGTDAEEYFDRGAGGAALYYSGGSTDYHTLRDSGATISPASVQQDGSYAVALARDLGNRVATRRRGGDWVAFNVAPDTAVVYPAGVDVALGCLAIALFGVAAVWGRRRRAVTVGGVTGGFLIFPLAVLGTGILVMLLWAATKTLVPDLNMPFVGSYQNTLYFLALAFAAVACFTFIYRLLLKRLKSENLALGALGFGAAMSLVLSVALPGSAYLFVLPVLIALGFRTWRLSGRATGVWHTAGAVALPLSVAVLLIVPVLALIVLALGARMELMTGMPVVGLLIGVFVAGAAGLFIPYLRPPPDSALGRVRWLGWAIPGAVALWSIALLLLATASLGFNSTHPRPDTINYELNADTGQASWLTRDSSLDSYTRQFFAAGKQPAKFEFFAMSTVGGWAANAPTAPLPVPTARLLSRNQHGATTVVRLWLASARHAPALEVHVSTVPISQASIDGQPVQLNASDRRGELKFIYWALPPNGIPLTLTVPTRATVHLALHDISYGLPSIPGHPYKPRPADTMSGLAFAGDATMVSHSTTVPAQ